MDFKFGALLIISVQICATLALPPCTCTRNLNPVCGSDGADYGNPCMLECAAYNSGTPITVAKQGPCEGSLPQVVVREPQEPVLICPAILLPVCGSDGKTYSNSCILHAATQHNSGLTFAHDGPCEDSVKVKDLEKQ